MCSGIASFSSSSTHYAKHQTPITRSRSSQTRSSSCSCRVEDEDHTPTYVKRSAGAAVLSINTHTQHVIYTQHSRTPLICELQIKLQCQMHFAHASTATAVGWSFLREFIASSAMVCWLVLVRLLLMLRRISGHCTRTHSTMICILCT